jgi:magnesium transporter
MSGTAGKILVESILRLLRRNADKHLARMLRRVHAADIAAAFVQLSPTDAVRLFRIIPDIELQGQTLSEADPESQRTILAALRDDELLEIIKSLSADDAADIIALLPDERSGALLESWKGDDANEVDTLLAYDEDTAGGIMSPHVFALSGPTTCREAIETLQASHEDIEMAFYLYVVNEHGQLIGVCNLRQLVVSDPGRSLESIMISEVVSVRTGTDQGEVARLVAKYNFLALPVVDEANKLVGLVTVDDVIDVIQAKHTEDLLSMAGAGGIDLDEQLTPFDSARRRMPWLAASFIAGIGSMFVINSFESVLSRVAALAAFIPITLGMGGNVGTQAATIVTRGLALGRVQTSQFMRVLGREVLVGLIAGATYGLLLGLFAAAVFRGGNAGEGWSAWQLAGTVSISVACSMTIAATLGGAVPLFFARIGIDPAVATNPLVTTTTDLVGVTIYFVVGRAFFHL